MKALFLTLLILVSACGKQKVKDKGPAKIYRVHAQIEPYVSNFQSLGLQTSHPAPIQYLVAEFKDLSFLGASVIGVCYFPEGGNGTPIIQLDPDFWANGESPVSGYVSGLTSAEIKAAREFVVFHELGHCRLGENHRDNLGYPSIMNTFALSTSDYLTDYDFLVNELFDPPSYKLSQYNISSSSSYLYDPSGYASHVSDREVAEKTFIYKTKYMDQITTL